MRSLNHYILILTIGSLCIKSHGQELNVHQWKNRILIIKTTNSDAELFRNQIDEFKTASKDLKERKLVLYTIINDTYTSFSYTNKQDNSSGKVWQTTNKRFLDNTEDFEVILIGLDGRIKLQQNEVLSKEELFSIIDAMPMRQNELKD